MIAIGRYLVFILCLAELAISADDDVLNDDEFLNYVLELHNEARNKHRVPELRRDNDVCKIFKYIYFLYI